MAREGIHRVVVAVLLGLLAALCLLNLASAQVIETVHPAEAQGLQKERQLLHGQEEEPQVHRGRPPRRRPVHRGPEGEGQAQHADALRRADGPRREV